MLHDCLAPDMRSSWLLLMWSSWLLYMWISWPLQMWLVWLVDMWSVCFTCWVRDSLTCGVRDGSACVFVLWMWRRACGRLWVGDVHLLSSWLLDMCWVRDSLHMELEMLHMRVWLLDMWSSWLLYPINELALSVRMDASHHTHECVMTHVWMRRVTLVNFISLPSHVWMRHRLHMNAWDRVHEQVIWRATLLFDTLATLI